jgi:hypothetical protein
MPFQNIYKQGQPTGQVDSGIKKYNIYESYNTDNTVIIGKTVRFNKYQCS